VSRVVLRLIPVTLVVGVVATLLPAPPAEAATQVPVLTTPNGEFQPARSESALAWEQNTGAQPNHYDVMLRPDGGATVQVNRLGTGAAMGDFLGSRLIYQQYRRNPQHRKGRSDLFQYNPDGGSRSKVPKVNSKLWEYWPSASGPWVLFARYKASKEVRWLFLQNLQTGERLRLDKTKGKNAFLGPGQVNGNHAVWYACAPVCNVYRFDITTRTEHVIANPGFYQRAPSVTPGGTVYFSRGGKGCGDGVSLVRAAPGGAQEVLVQLQNVLDIRDTYAYVEPNGVTEIYYERNGCGKAAASDIYKVLDPELAGLTVAKAGSGTGTVTSTPAGINCGTDCTQDYPGGSSVTLVATPAADSFFAGWSGACAGTGPCSVNMDAAKTVTATFETLGSITIVKDALPEAPQDFTFTPSSNLGSGIPFALDDDPGNATLPDQRIFSNLPTGTYTVQEAAMPGGWQLVDLTCVGGGADTTTGGALATIGLDPGEEVVCTFQNALEGSITIRKDALPDHGQDFRFDPSSNLGATDFFLDDDNDPNLPNEETFTDLPTGVTYSVLEENIPSGWQLSAIQCVNGGPNTSGSVATATATIGLDPGEAVVCTFTNQGIGSITVAKDALPNNAQDFGFTSTGGLSPATFSLDDDADGTLGNTRAFTAIPAGTTYTVAEDADPPGWQLTDLSCLGGGGNTSTAGRTATVGLDPGESVTCTFTDTQQASITVVKDAVPNDPQDFSFTTTGGLSPAAFSLDDDADGTLQNTRTYTGLLPGSFTVTEGADPPGWEMTDITCLGGGLNTSDSGRTATIGLDPGEDVTCTFTDQGVGSITVVKDAQPNAAQDFGFTTTGGLSPAAFSLDDDANGTLPNQQSFSDVAAGTTYTVSEDADPPGWQLTNLQCVGGGTNTITALGIRTATIGLDPGEDVTCTFTDTQEASITIAKDALPNGAQDFGFTTTGGLSPATFSLDDDADGTLQNTRTFTGLLPGSFTVTEDADPAGWQLTTLQCLGGGPNTTTAARTATIGLDAGENVTCTFTNTQGGSIVVTKQTNPDGSPQSFQFDPDYGPNFNLTDGTSNNSGPLSPGTYSVAEVNVPAGWTPTGATCSDGSPPGAINLAAGETVTCTFTNTQQASITVVKNALPNGAQDFGFTTTGGLSPAAFSLDDDADGTLQNTRTYTGLLPGSFTVTEGADPAGWQLTNLQCLGGGPNTTTAGRTATIGLDAGEAVTCTFTNQGVGSITVVKDAVPNSAQDFGFTTTGGLSPATFSLDDDANGTLPNQRIFEDLGPGTYTVTEDADPAGWELDELDCTGGGPDTSTADRTATIELDFGETVVCTFTNQGVGSIAIVKNAVPDAAQDFTFTTTGGLSPSPFSLDDDADVTLSNTQSFPGVNAGSYTVTEAADPAGWRLTNLQCTGGGGNTSAGGRTATIGLDPGESVTCTFTDTQDGTIVVTKETTPSGSPQSFEFDTNYSPNFTLTDGQNNTSPSLAPGTYSVQEVNVPAGWNLASSTCDDGSAPASIDLNPGETVTCTFTNVQGGGITIVKNAVNNAAQDFGFTTTGVLIPSSFTLDDDADPTLSNTRTYSFALPGTYTVTENADPAGWQLTDITCSGGGGNTSDTGRTATIGLDLGEHVTCMFTNTHEGSITIVKDAVPNDPQDFEFDPSANLDPGANFLLDDDGDGTLSHQRVFTDLLPGTYSVTEENMPAGWSLTSITCTDGSDPADITLSAGETVSCTFTNTQDAGPTITESFDKADGPGLGPDLAWIDLHDADWATSGGRARVPQGPEEPFIARADGDLTSADHYAEAPLTLNRNGDGQAGVAVRCSDTQATCYFALVSGNGDTPNVIGKMVNGTVVILAQENDGQGTGGVVRLEVVGSTLTLKVNGVTELTAVDTEITTGSRAGLAGATEPGAARWASFTAGTL
jgi:plastocyanin